jgi:penicillin-insensitive murein endopeptidase
MKISRLLIGVGVLMVSAVAAFCGYVAWLGAESARASVCRGDLGTGSLEAGRRLPYAGENFRAYSMLGYALGRTFAHGTIRDAVRDAYLELSKSRPELRFVYGESGWPWGGRFWPHKGHANGSAVDFFVPVRGADDKVTELPTWPYNLFGYAINFDGAGRSGSLKLDFEAMAQHLLALDRAARARGIGIQRVIFDVGLQLKLAATKSGAEAVRRFAFNKQQAWVRHDDHYHVEFSVRCR